MIGMRLRELRYKSGLSQEALARLTGISQAQVCRVESGERYPSLRYILRICRALRLFPNELLFEELMDIEGAVHDASPRSDGVVPGIER